jgi:hypothetical protein
MLSEFHHPPYITLATRATAHSTAALLLTPVSLFRQVSISMAKDPKDFNPQVMRRNTLKIAFTTGLGLALFDVVGAGKRFVDALDESEKQLAQQAAAAPSAKPSKNSS